MANQKVAANKPKARMTKAQKKRILQQRRRKLLMGCGAVLMLVLLIVSLIWQAHYPITASELREFGWRGSTSLSEIFELNHLLRQYHITSKPSLTMFFATVASESGKGDHLLEVGDNAYYAQHGYSVHDRGAGYLQITHRTEQLAFLQAMGDDFDGEDAASYIAEHYPWESACWEWSVGKTAPEPNPNEYAKEKGNTAEVFLATQYAINGWTIEDDMLRAIVQGAEYTVSEDGKTIAVNGQTAPTPINWPERLACYEQAKAIWG